MPNVNKNLVFAAACLVMLVFGIVMTILGPILPPLIERFGVDTSEAGSLFFLMGIGILIGSVVFGPVVDRYGYKILLTVCTGLVLVGLEGIAFAPSFSYLFPAVFVLGLGGGVINGGANALVADISTELRGASLSILGVFFGVGAFGVSLALGFLLDLFSYTSLIAVVGGLVLIPLAFFVLIRFPAPKQEQGFPLKESAGLIKDPVLLLFGLFLFLQSGTEITVGGWTTSFGAEELGLASGRAVFFVATFWLGMMVARIILGMVLRKAAAARVLQICLVVALVGALMMLLAQQLWPVGPGVFMVGAGLAAGFPVILGFVGDRYPRLSGTAFSLVLVIALLGGSIVPYVAGIIGDAFGLRASFGIVPINLCLMVVLLLVSTRKAATGQKAVSAT